jgi:hypothetical protein
MLIEYEKLNSLTFDKQQVIYWWDIVFDEESEY